MEKLLQEADFKRASEFLGCDVPAVKAVSKVESNGSGFNQNGTPKTLFEGHIFWQELKKAGKDPKKIQNESNKHVLYPTWTKIHYGKSADAEAKRLELAMSIDRECALRSASWGKFQIMGFNHKLAGFSRLQDFINAMYRSEGDHLLAFCNYVKARRLDDELVRKDWAGFAFGYNGSGYAVNKYDKKLADAYKEFSK